MRMTKQMNMMTMKIINMNKNYTIPELNIVFIITHVTIIYSA